MYPDGEKHWTRQLLVGVGALVAVALVIGGVVSAFALGAAQVAGIDDSRSGTSAEPSLVTPDDSPGATGEPRAAESSASPSPRATGSPTREPAERAAIRLRARPATVSPNERIDLTGAYPGGDGARLVVQRLDDGRWTDFPVTIGVDGRRFSSYIQTSRTGQLRFRVVDPAAGRVSNPVRVTVG